MRGSNTMNTLTVGELIKQLQQYDQDMLVVSCRLFINNKLWGS